MAIKKDEEYQSVPNKISMKYDIQAMPFVSHHTGIYIRSPKNNKVLIMVTN